MAVKSLGYAFGSNSGNSTQSITMPSAVANLSAHRVIVLRASGADYPSINAMEDGDAILGVTTSAAAINSPASYQFEGALSDPSWNWTIGPLWCGDNGVITQVIPTTGKWLRQIGEAIAPTKIVIRLFPTYYLQRTS